jgi:hypothetical protein
MRSIRLFAKGRLLPVTLLLIIADLLLSFRYWAAVYPIYLSGQGMPRYLIIPAVIGQVCTTLSLVCIAPRLPMADRLAVRRARLWSTATAAAVLGIEIATPLIIYAILSRIPTAMIPSHKDYVTDGLRFTDIMPLNTPIFTSATIALYAALAMCAISLMGKIPGTLVSFMGFIASIGVLCLLPYDTLHNTISNIGNSLAIYVCAAIAALTAALAVWNISRASEPLNPMKR